MSERKPLLKWVSRIRDTVITEFNTEPSSKVYVTFVDLYSSGLRYYDVWLVMENSLRKRLFKAADLDEVLLYAEEVIAATNPEFYLQQILSTDVTEVTEVPDAGGVTDVTGVADV